MGYLLYVSHDAENLQFYLWLQDYTQRFFAAPGSEQALSPQWDEDALPQPIGTMAADPGPRASDRTLAQTLDHNISSEVKDIPLSPMASPLHEKASFMSASIQGSDRPKQSFSVQQANTDFGLKWKSCEFLVLKDRKNVESPSDNYPVSIQPFRSEIDCIISHYLAPGAPRELNLSSKNRSACVRSQAFHSIFMFRICGFNC